MCHIRRASDNQICQRKARKLILIFNIFSSGNVFCFVIYYTKVKGIVFVKRKKNNEGDAGKSQVALYSQQKGHIGSSIRNFQCKWKQTLPKTLPKGVCETRIKSGCLSLWPPPPEIKLPFSKLWQLEFNPAAGDIAKAPVDNSELLLFCAYSGSLRRRRRHNKLSGAAFHLRKWYCWRGWCCNANLYLPLSSIICIRVHAQSLVDCSLVVCTEREVWNETMRRCNAN